MENRFVCNVTVFQVDLTEVEGARAGPDRTRPGSLLPAWPGAFYLRGQGPSTCVAKGPVTCVVKEPSTCVARDFLSAWPVAFYLRGQGACYLRGQGAFYRRGQGAFCLRGQGRRMSRKSMR